jgi:hypothetical protein
MPAITDFRDGFARAHFEMKALLGQLDLPDKPLLWYSQFGYHGYTIQVHRSHLQYLVDLNGFLTPDPQTFDAETIERWRLVNDLLIEGLQPSPVVKTRILGYAPMLACLTVFPTIEEVARRISMRWNEEGLLERAVGPADNVSTWKPDGTSEQKVYKAGQRIVTLSHKLQLMHQALDPRLAALLSTLDHALQHPMYQGQDQAMSPMYARLQYFRDHWLHGRRFDGWEALFVSLLLALVYFGSLVARHEPASDSVARRLSGPPPASSA